MVTRIKKIFPNLKTQKTRKSRVPVSLRSYRDEINYSIRKKQTKKLKPLHEEPRLKEWQHWALIENAYPYTITFKTNHMLIPKREVAKKDLSKSELAELDKILEELADVYDCHLTNFPKKQSRKNHFHIHMLTYKDHRREIRVI